jgi:hypothetical protein
MAPGQTIFIMSVDVYGDTRDEAHETLFMRLSEVQGATLARAEARGTIEDDDPLPIVSIVPFATHPEGHSGDTTMSFDVVLSAESGKTVTVSYKARNAGTGAGFASKGADFAAASGTLTFKPGKTQKTVKVAVRGDTTVEGNEGFFVDLTDATQAVLGSWRATGLIEDDDAP